MSPLTHLAAAAAVLLALSPAQAGATCYHFDNQVPGTSWAVDPGVAVPISIGQFRVRLQDGIRSFTLGAAGLRLDDLCIER